LPGIGGKIIVTRRPILSKKIDEVNPKGKVN
jgi:hypothetical protein